MAYGNVYRKLNRSRLHRKALLKNLAIALVKHERIVTTLAKAKEMRRVADRIITLGKKDTFHSKKAAFWWLGQNDLVDKLFGPLRSRYMERQGGYTRALRIPNRLNDNAPMAILEYVDNELPPLREPKMKKKRDFTSSSELVGTAGSSVDPDPAAVASADTGTPV